MKKFCIYILLVSVMLVPVSCLDKFPENAVAENVAITTIDEADQAVVGIYSSFLSGALYSGYLTLLPDIQCDMVYAVNGYTNTFGDVWRWEILATNPQIEAVYGSLYSLIGNCNFLLDNAEKLKQTLVDDDELDRLEMYCGEAYFARALAYSELIKLYCVDYKGDEEAKNELGVVLKTKYYEHQPIKRASLYDSYQLVLSDLDKAATLLKLDEDYDPAIDGYLYNNSVYFNEYTVYALRARVALYMRNYEDAIKYSSKIIDSGMYFLSSANMEYASAGMSYYDYMWQYDMSTEVIWKVALPLPLMAAHLELYSSTTTTHRSNPTMCRLNGFSTFLAQTICVTTLSSMRRRPVIATDLYGLCCTNIGVIRPSIPMRSC